MPEITEISGFKDILKDLGEKFKEISQEIIRIKTEFENVKLEGFQSRLIELEKVFENLMAEVLKGRITKESYVAVVRELMQRTNELLFFIDNTSKEGRDLIESVKELKDSFSELEISVTTTAPVLRALQQGIPLSNIRMFGATLGDVSSILRRFFGIALPLTVAEGLRMVIDLIKDWAEEATKTFTHLATGWIGAAEVSRSELLALGRYLDALGNQLMMSRRGIEEFIVAFRTSGLMFATDVGRIFLDLQRSFTEGKITVEDFAKGIYSVLEPLRVFGMSLGVTTEQVVRMISEWRRVMVTREMEDLMTAIFWLHRTSSDLNIDFNQLSGVVKGTIETTRLYGLDIFKLSGAFKDLGDLINYGIVSARDFIDVLVRGKESLDPNKHGTMLYFLANFGTTEEARQLGRAFLERGAAGIYEFSFLLTTKTEVLKQTYDTMDVKTKDLVNYLARLIGAFENGEVNWSRWEEFRVRVLREVMGATINLGESISGTNNRVIGFGIAMDLLQNTGFLTNKELSELEIKSRILKTTTETMAEADKEYIKTRNELIKVLDSTRERLNEFTTIMHDVNTQVDIFKGRLFSLNRMLEERAPERIPSPPSPSLAPDPRFFSWDAMLRIMSESMTYVPPFGPLFYFFRR